jgi:hypothetical protein
MEADGLELLVEAPNDFEDESAVGDGLAEVAEVLGLTLVEPAIIGDGEVTLTEGAKVGVGVQGARGLIPEELGLDGEPDVASRGAMLGDGVARSSVMVPKSQVCTTQSIRTQLAEVGMATSDRTWRSRE